jgi:hypothetical protein
MMPECLTYTVRLYIAGDIEEAKWFLRRECYPPNDGLCVTVEPTTFIYTGGEESGCVVGFVNYPRFPTTADVLFTRARDIAERLIPALCQWSALLVAPDRTEWLNRRPEGQR